MLHMVLFLLKIIGILLGIILGLLLILILVVLFVPIRYGIWADNREDLQGRARISWLLRIISLQITYVDETLNIKLKIFGKVFFDNLNPRKKMRKSQKTNIKVRQKKSRNVKKQTSQKKVDSLKINKSLEANVPSLDKRIDTVNANIDSVNEKELKSINIEHTNKVDKTFESTVSSDGQKKESKFFDKIKNILKKIKNFFRRMIIGLQKVKNFFWSIVEFITDLLTKWDKIKAFYGNETNKLGIKKSFHTIKRIVKHILPKKINAFVEFGTGDPCTTGQVLGMIACFFGFYGKSIRIVPNFNDQILKGNIYIYGRIRIATLLIIVVKLILDKNFKKLMKNFRAFKEDL